jgi:hypothetical protein
MATKKTSSEAGLRPQFATSSGRGGRRNLPRAFSEHGALMAAAKPKIGDDRGNR